MWMIFECEDGHKTLFPGTAYLPFFDRCKCKCGKEYAGVPVEDFTDEIAPKNLRAYEINYIKNHVRSIYL